MENVLPLAQEWAQLEGKLCSGNAWEELSDSEKEEVRECLRENFESYKERSFFEIASARGHGEPLHRDGGISPNAGSSRLARAIGARPADYLLP